MPPRGSHTCRVTRPQPEKGDKRADVLVARLAAEQWGVVSVAELRTCGLNDDAIRVRVANGRLHPLHRAVYAVGHPSIPLEGRFLAAVKACGPRAALSHYSGASLWEAAPWDERRIEVTIVGTAPRSHRGIRVHRTLSLAGDVTRHKGIRVTTPARTLLDLAATTPYGVARRAARQAQSLRRVSIPQLTELLGRSGRRPGTRNLARIVATGPAPTRSELEDLVLDLVAARRARPPRRQRAAQVNGRRVVPDFRWPGQRLVVEADGAAWHDHKLARGRCRAQALLEAHGERVLRVTWDQALLRPAETLRRISAAGAPAEPCTDRWSGAA